MGVNKILALLNFLDLLNLSFLKILIRKYIVKCLLIIKNDFTFNNNNKEKVFKTFTFIIIISLFMFILKNNIGE